MPNTDADIPLAQALKGERTRKVLDYWRELAGTAPAPDWASFNLMDLYRDAPIMLVLDVLPGPGVINYRYRFVGTQIVQYRWKLPVPGDGAVERLNEYVKIPRKDGASI